MNYNEELTSYLNYLVDLEKSPNFAVMIDGEWGSGKTWFVRKLM
ncbi:TPA: P-loop NTPase fold protein, partial [Escherichia coli]